MKKSILVLVLFFSSMLYANELQDLLAYDEYNDGLYHYIPRNCVDILYSKDRLTIKDYYPDYEELTYYYEAYDKFVYWYEQNCYANIFISLYNRNGYDVFEIGNDELGAGTVLSFLIEEYETKNGLWYLTCHEIYNTKVMKNSSCFHKWPLENDECVIILKIDGDYIDIYINDLEHYYDTYCRVYYKLLDEYNSLIKNNKCNLKDLKWPRHADGSCDYDGSKKTVVSQTTNTTPTTNVSINKTMLVSENLKLRSGEAITTQVLTVMAAGTKVKIIELGKAETIDSINSNWVKVEVQAGAKDKDGKSIKKGTIGWCYGGYLK